MKIPDIIKQINKLVSNSSSFKLNFERLEFYLDSAIDFINDGLLTNYPTINDYWYNNINYWSIVYSLKITPYNITNTKQEFGNWFNEKENKIYVGDKPIEQCYGMAEFPNYLFICETNKLYVFSDNYTYVEKPYELLTTMPNDFDYNIIPDKYIRSCLIYKASALYLEEEDELESQYQTYSSKANIALATWKKQYYSMYECNW